MIFWCILVFFSCAYVTFSTVKIRLYMQFIILLFSLNLLQEFSHAFLINIKFLIAVNYFMKQVYSTLLKYSAVRT